ncbi:MAG: hypothetical protein ABIO84_10730, partial [Lysobacter sp.]
AAAPIARTIFDAWLLGKMPEGMAPTDDVVSDPLQAAAEASLDDPVSDAAATPAVDAAVKSLPPAVAEPAR